MIRRWIGRLLSGAMVLAVLAGCGPLREARDTARGVDDAVSLLQDLADRGAWDALREGAAALEDLDHGYAAELEVRTAAATPLSAQIQADADGEALITVAGPEAGVSTTYYVSAWRNAETPGSVYRLADSRYTCADGEAEFLRGGLGAALQRVAAGAIGPEMLAVRALEGDEVTQVGREATRYALESRRADAVEVLRELENADLAARVEAAGELDFSGAIVLDDETGALLAVESATVAAGGEDMVRLSFEVTQWNAAEDISTPGLGEIAQPCG